MEKDIENTVCRYAEKLGVLQRKFKTPGRRNAPDRLFLTNGTAFFIEFKDTGKTPRRGQVREAEKLRARGFDVWFVDNVNEGKKVIEHYAYT